jgi:glycerophosphoryl diester phosphodiesterase
VIELRRREGGPLRVGHRGAGHLAPENTLAAFREAIAHGCDLIEFDVLDLVAGPLVLAHSNRLDEVSHGRSVGTVRDLTLDQLREHAPEVPTLDEALAFFVDEAPGVGLHVDLKLRVRLDELCDAIARHGLSDRAIVSGTDRASLRTVAAHGIRTGYTYPDDKLGISRRQWAWPVVSLGLSALRASVPHRVPRRASMAGASAIMLQHRLVTERLVERAHRAGLAVFAWTVDDPTDVTRVTRCGVDGVITNDPRVFALMS